MNTIKVIIGNYFNVLSVVFPKMAGKQLFYFFCYPFKAKLKPAQQSFLDTAKKETVLVDGKKIMTYQWGTGPKSILFVHGWQSHSFRWKAYIDRFDKTKYKIIAFDAPGHGNSEGLFSNVPLYEQALHQIFQQIGKPDVIVSHSIGAFSSMYFMHKNKNSVSQFVSLATPFTADQFIKYLEEELKLNEKAVFQLRSFFTGFVGQAPQDFSLDLFAQSIRSKSLIIHDANDETTSVDHSKTLHELLDDSALMVTEGYGHRLKSKAVVEQVYDFIESSVDV